MLSTNDIAYISTKLPNAYYRNNVPATRQLVELLDKKIRKSALRCPDDYVKVYEDTCFTYKTFDEFVESELEQGVYGFTKEECKDAINKSVFQLPCGWWVQFV